MTEPRLPPIDPNYLIEEDDPETLEDYARGLLLQWHTLETGGASRAGYPKKAVKAATAWLLQAYFDAELPLCRAAAELVRVALEAESDARASNVQTVKQDAYWTAIKFEAGFPPDQLDKYPSLASNREVAAHLFKHKLLEANSIEAAEATVRTWRQRLHYRGNVALYRASKPEVK